MYIQKKWELLWIFVNDKHNIFHLKSMLCKSMQDPNNSTLNDAFGAGRGILAGKPWIILVLPMSVFNAFHHILTKLVNFDHKTSLEWQESSTTSITPLGRL